MPNPRSDFLPIVDRPALQLPKGNRVAVSVIINAEERDFKASMARTVLPFTQGIAAIPDVANYGWYDYGQRVGFWRIKEVLDKHGIRASVSFSIVSFRSSTQILSRSTFGAVSSCTAFRASASIVTQYRS